MSDENKYSGNNEDIRPDKSIDTYNEELSRKAVGKLFDSPEDEKADNPRNLSKTGDSFGQKPINNYFYEDSRAEASDNTYIVKGFKKDKAKETDSEKEVIDEKQRYRRQFFGDFDNNTRRQDTGSLNKSRKPAADDDFYPRPRSGRNTEKLSAIDSDDELGGEIKYVKAGHTQSRRPERSGTRPEGYPPRAKAPKQSHESQTGGKSFTAMPLFKIMCGGIAFLFLLSVFLMFQLNASNSVVKEYKEQEKEMLAKSEEMDSIIAQKDSAERKVKTLQSENLSLQKQVDDLEKSTNPEPEQTGEEPDSQGSTGVRSYTVVSGDTLSGISAKMYGNAGGVNKIMTANNMTNANLSIGQVLTIPE